MHSCIIVTVLFADLGKDVLEAALTQSPVSNEQAFLVGNELHEDL